MSKYFLVPDLHGELDMASALLMQEGLIDDSYERAKKDVIVVQMGDMLNCVASSLVDDNRCLDFEHWFDVLLVGNHEHPYFNGPAFAGWWKDPVLTHRIRLLDAQNRYKVAIDCDGILVTHAGLVSHYEDLWFNDMESEDIAKELNFIWKRDKTHEIFSAIGWERGGYGKWGSILWADWKQYKATRLKQIVGHSVNEFVRVQCIGKQFNILPPYDDINEDTLPKEKWEALCIDLGAGKHSPTIVGAWIEDGNVRLVEYRKAE